ncbi:MAG: Phenylacetic acid degradation protein [Chitinophagaceae bacterium]|nr:Phenylacetic acid degradation protein [Chitinophagaceae bacterium]
MKNELIDFTLYLADNALIIGHRNSEWCGHGPVLEQDIAITNISLDLIGQARNFYQYAAQLINEENTEAKATEDTLAYLRDGWDFKNSLLTEHPNGDWAQTITRQFFFSVYQYYLYQQLQNCSNEQIAAIAIKALKEVTYHVKWSSEWMIRLGDGTEESNSRLKKAIDNLWMFTGELFDLSAYESVIYSAWNIDNDKIKNEWESKVKGILEEATLEIPVNATWHQSGGKTGTHSEHLGFLLAEMQSLQRAYPGNEW